MKSNLFFYLLITSIVILSYFISGAYYLLVISILLILTILLSGICMLINISKIHMEVIEEKGQWKLLYKTSSMFPLGKIHVRTHVYNCFFDEKVYVDEVFLTGKKQMEITLPLLSKIGTYTMSDSTVMLWDLFSLFKKRLPSFFEGKLCVYPTFLHTPNEANIAYQFEQRNNERMDEYDLREYRNGDALKDIHHKISYKMQKLIVKEKLKKKEENIHMLLDLSGNEEECLLVLSYFHIFMEKIQFYDETCVVHWYSNYELHEKMIKTLMDKEELIRFILSHPKAMQTPASNMWTITSNGLEKGEAYE